jgi:hypothetical protein
MLNVWDNTNTFLSVLRFICSFQRSLHPLLTNLAGIVWQSGKLKKLSIWEKRTELKGKDIFMLWILIRSRVSTSSGY